MIMRKTLVLLALAFQCISAAAQEWDYGPRFEISGGFGMAPLVQADRFNSGYISTGTLASIFRPYNAEVKMTGAFSAEFGFRTGRRWSISLMASCNHVSGSTLRQVTGSGDSYSAAFKTSNVNGNSIAVIPRWRYDYIIKPGFRMYSSFGMGFGLYLNYHSEDVDYDTPLQGEVQLVPLGISFGRKWFGLVETGFGSQYVGGRIGFGYRF